MRKIISKLKVLLDKKQKRQMVGIVILMLIGGVLESLGIAMIAPVMQVVIDPQKVEESKVLSGVYNLFNLSSTTQLAALIMVALILVFVIKNVFIFFMNVVQLRFV